MLQSRGPDRTETRVWDQESIEKSGIVMTAGDKWLNEGDVVVNKKPKAPKKSHKSKKPKATQASGSPRKVTIILSGAPDENIVLKKPAPQDQSEVVVKKVTPEKTIVVTEEPRQQRKSAVDTRPATFPTEEQVEELLGTASDELTETADSSILDDQKQLLRRDLVM